MSIECIFKQKRTGNAGVPGGEFTWFCCQPIAVQRRRDIREVDGFQILPGYSSECDGRAPLSHCLLENPEGVLGAIQTRREYDKQGSLCLGQRGQRR